MLSWWMILLLLIYFFFCVVLICAILLQSGKGGGLSSLAGGGGGGAGGLSDAIGATGAEKTLSNITSGIAVMFMLMAILLSILGARSARQDAADEIFGETAPPAATIPGAVAPGDELPEDMTTFPGAQRPSAPPATDADVPTVPGTDVPEGAAVDRAEVDMEGPSPLLGEEAPLEAPPVPPPVDAP